MVGGTKFGKDLSQFRYDKLKFGSDKSSSVHLNGKSHLNSKDNKNNNTTSDSSWLTSTKPTKNGINSNEDKKSSQHSLASKVPSRKRIRCIVSSDEEDDNISHENSSKKMKLEKEDTQKGSPSKLEDSKNHINTLCLKFSSVPRPDVIRILRECNFNVDSATVKLSLLHKAKIPTFTSPPSSPEKKNNLGSIKAFKANRMMERINNSNVSNTSVQSNPREEESPQLKTTKRVKVLMSDSECEGKQEEEENDDEDEEEEEDDEESNGDPIMEAMILNLLNSSTLDELTSMNGCSKKKAEAVVNMRPFDSWRDLKTKLEDNRLIGTWLIDECRDLLKVRDNVKQLMESCQSISASLESSISDIMGGGKGSQSNGGKRKYLVKQPSLLCQGLKLTAYQMIGINWLNMMHTHKLNGILGDEMGLGKTIQTIAFLAHLLSQGNKGPHVIVCPSSTIDNWLRELQKWCPSMKVVPYYGSQEERRDLRNQLLDGGMDVNVILTSYNMAAGSQEDKVLFKKFKYVYAIFDEGHMLKNMTSSRYKNLTKISSERRLLLTGTPLQNNLLELISLLSFLMPDIFAGRTDQLKKIFSVAKNEKDDSSANQKSGTYIQETLVQAKKILQPFFLRRLKADVLQQLPKKTENTVKVALTSSQCDLYNDLKVQFTKDVSEKSGSGASMMMQLRKAANHELLHRRFYDDDKLKVISKKLLKHPDHRGSDPKIIFEDLQFMSDFEIHSLCKKYEVTKDHRLPVGLVMNSGKFNHLDNLLPTLKKKGDKVLLFSQFTMVLDIVEEYMEERNHKYLRLDGSTPVIERQDLIDQFTEDEDIFVFLLSTKAGGMGINLVAANVVIIHDIDFNPYNDKQAEDRCHRVGQTRDVTLYKLIGKNTIEEAMLKCAQEKLKLEKEVTGTNGGEEISSGDVASLLKEALKMK